MPTLTARQSTIPAPVIYDPSTSALLTPPVRDVMDNLLLLLMHEAQGVQVERTVVEGVPASDEAPARLVVVSHVRGLTPDDALTYWDALGAAVERWAADLPPSQAEIALDQISLDVRWDSHAADL